MLPITPLCNNFLSICGAFLPQKSNKNILLYENFWNFALKLAQNMLHNPAQLASRKKGINSVVQEYKLLYFCDAHTYSGKLKLTLILQNS